jgi:hypothetical protein
MPVSRRYLLLFLTVALNGCGTSQTSFKSASLGKWSQAWVGNVRAQQYLLDRWGIVICGRGPIAIEPNGATLDLRNVVSPGSGSGAAVHLHDGYWLTAAHCVPTDDVHIARVRPLAPLVLVARVVWRGRSSEPGEDLALLWTDVSNVQPPIADMPSCAEPPGTGAILCAGSGITSSAWAGGEIQSVESCNDPNFRIILHNSPLGPGDSGGPAMLADGRLAGINVLALQQTRNGQCESWANWVSPDFIQRMIEQDRGEKHGE